MIGLINGLFVSLELQELVEMAELVVESFREEFLYHIVLKARILSELMSKSPSFSILLGLVLLSFLLSVSLRDLHELIFVYEIKDVVTPLPLCEFVKMIPVLILSSKVLEHILVEIHLGHLLDHFEELFLHLQDTGLDGLPDPLYLLADLSLLLGLLNELLLLLVKLVIFFADDSLVLHQQLPDILGALIWQLDVIEIFKLVDRVI